MIVAVGARGISATGTPMNLPEIAVLLIADVTFAATACAAARSGVMMVAVTVIEPAEILRVISATRTPFPHAAARLAV